MTNVKLVVVQHWFRFSRQRRYRRQPGRFESKYYQLVQPGGVFGSGRFHLGQPRPQYASRPWHLEYRSIGLEEVPILRGPPPRIARRIL